jgi:hypothetical protein
LGFRNVKVEKEKGREKREKKKDEKVKITNKVAFGIMILDAVGFQYF